MNFEIKLDSVSLKLISLFESIGVSAYAVGGCVRDSLSGRPVSDIDLAVSCTPDNTKKILDKNNIRYIETGIQHGTVTAIAGGRAYEITTFRSDGKYSDNRRPDSVSFVTDIYTDLARRDFTVNAMAYNPSEGLIDIFCGIDDIKSKTIRAVGDADTRFMEDSLRILRALRFASVLDFEIEQKTEQSILKKYPLLRNVAKERITEELIKLLSGKGASRIIRKYSQIILYVSGHLKTGFDVKNGENLCKIFDVLADETDIRVAAFILINSCPIDILNHSIGPVDTEIVKKMTSSLRLRSATVQNTNRLLTHFDTEEPRDRVGVKKLMFSFGAQFYIQLLELRLAVFRVMEDKNRCDAVKKVLAIVNDIMDKHEPYSIAQLEINGNDLKALGCSGKRIGVLLEEVLEMVIEQRLENNRDSIIKYVTEHI